MSLRKEVDEKKWKRRMTLSQMTILSALLGISVGIFFGERTEVLEIFGKSFLRLIQMALVPYIIVALIKGFASLSTFAAKSFFKNAGAAFLIVWGCSYAVIYIAPLAFPSIDFATFFSTNYLVDTKQLDLVEEFIPANPFTAVVENSVPGFVFFCICLGLVLATVEKKKSFIETLETLQQALTTLAFYIYRLTPIAVFAMMATAVGTLNIQDLVSLQVYFLSLALAALLLSLLVIPLILTALLPFTYRELFNSMRGALLLSFSAMNSFIAIPLVIKEIEELYKDRLSANEKEVEKVEMIVPLSYTLPTMGKLLNIIFVFFTAWLYDRQFSFFEQLFLAFSGFLNLFGEGVVAMPSLLNLFMLPADSMEIFILSNLVTKSFETMANAASMFAVGVLYVGFSTGFVRLSSKRLSLSIIQSLFSSILAFFFLGQFLSFSVNPSYNEQKHLMNQRIESSIDSVTYIRRSEVPERAAAEPLQFGGEKNHSLRVGYNINALPFAYFNNQGQLVGFDIAVAYRLAKALKMKLEFIPFDYSTVAEDIESGFIDIAMSSVTITEERMEKVNFSTPYMTLHLGFITPDYKRGMFGELERLRQWKGLRIAIIKGSAYYRNLRRILPDAEVVEVEKREEFFQNDIADAFFTSAEQGFAWTLLYPEYAVVILNKASSVDLVGYPIAKNNSEFLYQLNLWLKMNGEKGVLTEEYNRWVLGKAKSKKEMRWSILDNLIYR